jgi:uncharacterized protein (TIGR02145 family)
LPYPNFNVMSICSFAPSRARRICGILVGLVLAPAATGQTTITAPYNPDSDADSVIAILDLMSVLSIYGDAFEPAEILVDGVTLQEFIDALEESADCTVGCPDELACNYDSTATVGIACTCDYISCAGCTDSGYLEYDPSATVDDGSCATLVVEGCTDETASNFNPDANSDDGSCDYSTCGCSPVTFDGHTYEVVEIGTQCWFAENLRTTVYANGDAIPIDLSDSEWISTNSGGTTVYGEGTSTVQDESDNEVANLEAYGRLYNWYAVDDSRGLCPAGWHVPTDEEWMELEMELGMSSSEANSTGYRGTDQGTQMKSSSSDSPSWDGTNTSGFFGLPGGWRSSWTGSFFDQEVSGGWWSNSSNVSGAAGRELYSDNSQVYRLENFYRGVGFSVRCVLGTYEVYGCTDPSSCNFDAFATIDDGSCGVNSVVWSLTTDDFPSETTWQITDSAGFVFADGGPYSLSQTTTIDTLCLPDGCFTLTVFDSYGDGMQYQGVVGNYALTDSNGEVLAEMIAGGDFGSEANHEFCLTSPAVLGCTDPSYLEYDPSANSDDGSCATLVVEGCTDETASNFNPDANSDDGSCDYSLSGCDPVTFDGHTYEVIAIGTQCWFAENLRTTVYADGTTIPANLSDSDWSSTTSGATTVYGEGSSTVYEGSSDEVANLEAYGRLYNWYAVDDSRGLCPIGWHVPTDDEWFDLTNLLGGSSVAGTAMKSSPADDPSWDGTNTSGFSALPGGSRDQSNGSFDEGGILGEWWSATPLLTIFAWHRRLYSYSGGYGRTGYNRRFGFSVRCLRDEEYQAYGCTDSAYLEYNPLATIDDGSCATLVVEGCTDETAWNYNPSATSDDGSCDYSPSGCDPVTFDGYTYDVVEIGSQCWFAENLRTETYANGEAIQGNLSSSEWTSTSSGAQVIYSNEVANLEAYGRLYNWYAVDDSRGLCPSGWHVPTDAEWMTLEVELGMSSSESNSTGWRGTDEGKKLKSSPQDSPAWNGYDSGDPLNSGFSALPGGRRDDDLGYFLDGGSTGYWWSASYNFSSYASNRALGSDTDGVFRGSYYHLRSGFSVRCLKDEFEGYGCTDAEAVNYDPLANVDDGSCTTLVILGCTDSEATNYNPIANTDDGYCYYTASTCLPVNFDGHTYEVVEIGSQCWFAENLRTTVYANGDSIPGDLSNSDWTSATSGAQTIYLNNSTNLEAYGRLYNWYAVDDNRGLCPSGWHVPTNWPDWSTLIDYFGGSELAGTALKSSPADNPSWDGTNISGFSAPPGGSRGAGGYFSGVGTSGDYWSASAGGDPTYSWGRGFDSDEAVVTSWYIPRNYGMAVRCVSDE